MGRVAGDTKSAIAMLERFVAQEANYPVAYYFLARAYRTAGDQAAASKALEGYELSRSNSGNEFGEAQDANSLVLPIRS